MDRQTKRKNLTFVKNAPFAGIGIMILLITGLVVDATKADGDSFYADIIRLDNVATKIHQNYVEEMPSKNLIDNAIKGMLETLDPHTSYFEAKQYEELKIHTEGKFGGLGIQISIRDKVLTVMTPIAGTPASRAGIQSGDQIIKIDGKPTKGFTIDKAVSKLRGEPGTPVEITIKRKGETKDIDYSIKREIIHIKSVPYYGMLENGIGYIHLQTFSQEAGAEVERAIKELAKNDLKGLIFDLRHNPGGLLPQAIEVAEKFLPRKSLVVSTRGRIRGQNKEFYSASQPVLPENISLAVLVDYASASASEIVSGAIQDWDRGIIVGDTTFGKGSVQSILPLGDKTHHLKLTTAFYYTPSGRCINRPENSVRNQENTDEEEMEEDSETDNKDNNGTKNTDTKIDTVEYKTKNGRVVFGSGGIIPDSVVDIQYISLPVRAIFGKDAFFQFANHEYPKLKKRKVKVDRNFELDETIMNDFYAYLDSINFTYSSLAQIRFDEFKLSAGIKDSLDSDGKKVKIYPELPDWNDKDANEIRSMAEKLDSLLVKDSRSALANNEDEIKKYLREALLIREYGQDHEMYYKSKLADDPQLKVAYSIISDEKNYKKLLQPKNAVETENLEK